MSLSSDCIEVVSSLIHTFISNFILNYSFRSCESILIIVLIIVSLYTVTFCVKLYYNLRLVLTCMIILSCKKRIIGVL